MATQKWVAWAEAELGIRETPGSKSTKRIVDYRALARIDLDGDDGQLPWCAIFVNAALESSGIRGSRNAAARGFLKWGVGLKKPVLGCIVVLATPGSTWQGHVGFYDGETSTHVRLLGGNQGDSVSKALFPKSRILGYRWPEGVPIPGSGPVLVAAAGDIEPTDR